MVVALYLCLCVHVSVFVSAFRNEEMLFVSENVFCFSNSPWAFSIFICDAMVAIVIGLAILLFVFVSVSCHVCVSVSVSFLCLGLFLFVEKDFFQIVHNSCSSAFNFKFKSVHCCQRHLFKVLCFCLLSWKFHVDIVEVSESVSVLVSFFVYCDVSASCLYRAS